MSLFNEKSAIRIRVQFAITATVFFASSWCLSLISGNYFWLCLSRDTYFAHLAIWVVLGVLIFVLIFTVGRRYNWLEDKLTIFIFILCFLNLLDYGMRSIFGPVSRWPLVILIIWSMITLLYPAAAIFLAYKYTPSRHFIKLALRICTVPTLLFIYYAIPTEFAVLKIEKPLIRGDRTPIHFILFDMLSYEFLFENNRVKPSYNNFKSFSNEADVYLNAFSPSGSTAQAVPRIATGIDFENISYNLNRWMVRRKDSTVREELSSYETIFSIANKNGYNVFLRAFAIPYLNNFGDHIQSGKVHPFDTLWRIGMHSLIWPFVSPGGIQHQKTTGEIFSDYAFRIRTSPNNTFFYTHWNIPHDPFVYDVDGLKLNRIEIVKNLILKPDRRLKYHHQLKGTDLILGRLIEILRNSEAYDESLIIVTSDHNISGYGLDMKHVPLLIKRPYQNKKNIIESEVTTKNIINIIKSFINEGRYNNITLGSIDGIHPLKHNNIDSDIALSK